MPDAETPAEAACVHTPGSAERRGAVSIPIAVALLVLAAYALITAAALPTPQGWTTSPALFTLAVAAGLASTVLALLIQRLGNPRHRRVLRPRRSACRRDGVQAIAAQHGLSAAQFLLLGIYVHLLLPVAPFEPATALFLLGAGLLADGRPPAPGRLVAALAFPPAFALVAAGLLRLPLPGNGSLVLQVLDASGLPWR
jgi:hypothetical protein